MKEKIQELYDSGYTPKEVSILLGISKQAVSYHVPYGKKKKLLTLSDRIILVCIANGMTTKQIAIHMDKKEVTIERARFLMMKMLNCKTAAHLVAWGFKNKYLI